MSKVFALALAVLWSGVSFAEDGKHNFDGDGEQLPPGARFRLGTRQWRHTGECAHVAWSADGKQLAVSSLEGVHVHDAANGSILWATGEPHVKCALAFSPDGKELACSSSEGEVVAYDPVTGRKLRTYALNAYECLAYSPKGSYLAAVAGFSYAVLERASKRRVLEIDNRATIQGCVFTPDEKSLIVSSVDPSIKVWDLAKRKTFKEWSLEKEQFLYGPAIAPNGKYFAVGGQYVTVVDARTFQTKLHLKADDPISAFSNLEYTNDGKLLVAASQNGSVYVWDAVTYDRRWKLNGGFQVARSMAVDSAGKYVAVGDAFNRIWIWNLETGKLLFDDLVGHNHEVHAVAWSRDGARIATGSGGLTTHLWNAHTGQHERSLATSSRFLYLSRDGTTLLSTWHSRQSLREWDVTSGELQNEWPLASEGTLRFAMSQDQSRLVQLERLPRDTWRVRGYSFPGMEQQWQLEGKGSANWVSMSPSGKYGAFAAYDEGIKLFSFDLGKVVTTLRNPDWGTEGVGFTLDDRFFLAGGNVVYVFELVSGKLANRFTKHNRPVGALAVSPNGRVVVSTDGQRSRRNQVKHPHCIRFWDISTCREIGTLSGHDTNVNSIAFSPDGTQLISGLQDASALVWDVPAQAQQVLVNSQAIRATELENVWRELSSPEATTGQRSVLRLVNDAESALALLEERLKPIGAPDEKEIQMLIAKLEDDDFKVRQASFNQLASYGKTITRQLTAAARGAESNDVRLRCRELLEDSQTLFPL